MRPARTTKKTNVASGASKGGPTTTSSQGRRDQGGAVVNKNVKEHFIKKLQLCSKTYDWKDESKDVKAKSERLNAIQEIQQLLTDQKNVVSIILPYIDEVMQMIEKNIFRPLPSVKKSNLNFAETGIDQEEEMDPAWPHLQGIYEFFLQLVINESVEVK